MQRPLVSTDSAAFCLLDGGEFFLAEGLFLVEEGVLLLLRDSRAGDLLVDAGEFGLQMAVPQKLQDARFGRSTPEKTDPILPIPLRGFAEEVLQPSRKPAKVGRGNRLLVHEDDAAVLVAGLRPEF